MISKETHKKKKNISPVRQIAISFFLVIIIGSILLSLPFSHVANSTSTYLDHLFVSTSATCVTGLVTHVTAFEYTLIGQIIILLLIQIGGLGFLTLMSMMFVVLKKRLSFSNKIVMQEALNRDSLADTSKYIKRVIKYTAFFEILGMICLSFVFIPELGFVKGLYFSVFHAISAFCNAGFDIIGDSSLMPYFNNVWINIVICGLIISGGLGFVVWIDIRESFKKYKNKFKIFIFKKYLSSLSLHTKIVIKATLSLIVLSAMIVFALEYNNPNTIGPMSFFEKVIASFFQSVTLRTAGFATIDQALLTPATKMISSIIMFIGGSPAGTAGGIKTVTMVIMLLYIRSLKRGEENVHVMKRTISNQIVNRSLTIVIVSLLITLTGIFALSITEQKDFIDLVFEAFSAFATVGLTAGITPLLTNIGKMVIIVLMYIGRIGPITMVLIFVNKMNNRKGSDINYIEERVLIG